MAALGDDRTPQRGTVGTPDKPVRAAIYCRVSTKEQTKNLSLTTQQKVCIEYCEREGFEVDRVFIEEGESAKTTDRPKFQELLSYCRENKGRVQVVVVYDLSRFARDTFDHYAVRALLSKFGASLRSATQPIDETSTGVLMEGILAAFAHHDNRRRAEVTIAGMKAALSAGRWTFHPPIGYLQAFDAAGRRTIVPDPERAPLIRKAFELYATGLHSKAEVLKVITELGLRTRKGGKVSMQTFHQTLRKPIYAGWLTVKSWGDLEPMRGDFEPLVTDDTFKTVQAVLDGKKLSVTPHDRNNPDFPLRVFVRCSECGTPLTGSWSQGRSDRYPYYRCRSSACLAVKVRKGDMESQFVSYLRALVPEPGYLNLFREIVLDVWKQRHIEVGQMRRHLQARLDDLLARKDQMVDAFVHRRVIDQATYQRHADKLDEDITLAELALHDARTEELDVEGVLNFAEHVLLNAPRMWVESSPEQKQRLQRVLFPKGVTYSPGSGFGTTETSVIFRLLEPLPAQNEREASPTGFEPTSPAGRKRAKNAGNPVVSRVIASSARSRKRPENTPKNPPQTAKTATVAVGRRRRRGDG
jgi:site-specific DNA recombinase